MPETFGKRERKKTQERKAAAREERRLARRQRRAEGPAPLEELEPLTGPRPLDDVDDDEHEDDDTYAEGRP
jgi:hypothetical protein